MDCSSSDMKIPFCEKQFYLRTALSHLVIKHSTISWPAGLLAACRARMRGLKGIQLGEKYI